VAKTDDQLTVENSETSAKSGRKRTAPALSAADRLEILQQAAMDAKAAGLPIDIYPLFDQGRVMVVIVIDRAELVEGKIVAINGKGGGQ
jgi:hypothetical protein